MKNLVTVDWLAAHLEDDLTILDCTNSAVFDPSVEVWRTQSGRPAWQEARIPGSRHADFAKGLSGQHPRYRNSLPDPAAFAQALGGLGVTAGRRVILYDTAQSMWAARLWWMLRWIGFDDAWVLDGGLHSWRAAGHPLDSAPAPSQPVDAVPSLGVSLRPDCFVDSVAVRAALEDRQPMLVDALSAEQFNGTGSELGLCGHIPGAHNVPAGSLVDPQTQRFLEPDTLRSLFPAQSDRPVIAYCGSGVSAASAAFCMTQLGFEQVSVYMPGLQEWVELADAPIEIGGRQQPLMDNESSA